MEQFQEPGACLVVEPIIREGIDDASQEKGQSCLFFLERYRERSTCGQDQEFKFFIVNCSLDSLGTG